MLAHKLLTEVRYEMVVEVLSIDTSGRVDLENTVLTGKELHIGHTTSKAEDEDVLFTSDDAPSEVLQPTAAGSVMSVV
ncbi:hypothetical protein HDU90_000294 [Geranomyces variabilis]|nr:hypothetical protein HDU90_000294 [Geranomyces variabilis]